MSEVQTTEISESEGKEKEAKSQAQLDYEGGQEFLKKGDAAQAANAFHNALLGFQQEKNVGGIANASDKLGDICFEKNDFEQAIVNWETAHKICTQESDRTSAFSIEKKRAKLYWQWKKYDQAIALYLGLLDEYHHNNNPQGSVETLETLSQIHLENGSKSKAAECLRTVASIHKNFKHVNFYKRFMERADEIEKG